MNQAGRHQANALRNQAKAPRPRPRPKASYYHTTGLGAKKVHTMFFFNPGSSHRLLVFLPLTAPRHRVSARHPRLCWRWATLCALHDTARQRERGPLTKERMRTKTQMKRCVKGGGARIWAHTCVCGECVNAALYASSGNACAMHECLRGPCEMLSCVCLLCVGFGVDASFCAL
jgi:hypothetical protein